MTLVIDASLAVKWFLQEHDSNAAGLILADHIGNIIVPTLFGIEVTATLVREANLDRPNADAMRVAIARLEVLQTDGSITTAPETPAQISHAARIAIDLGHPLKDCIYLTLAMEQDCELVTCDARFAAKAKGVWGKVRFLGDGG